MGFRLLALGVVGVHLGYLAYLVFGGLVAARWPATIAGHLAAVAWAVLAVVAHLPCPLTAAQNALRARAGQPPLPGGFLDTYVQGVFYPAGRQGAAQAVVAVVVLGSWVLVALRLRHRYAARADRHSR